MTNHHKFDFYRGLRGDEEFLIKAWPDGAFRTQPVSEPKSDTRGGRRTNNSRD